MKYRKKPVVIDAIQWTNDYGVIDNILDMESFFDDSNIWWYENDDGHPSIRIRTLEGEMTASPGDYIIKGIKGEYYPCKPDIFEQTYELCEEV